MVPAGRERREARLDASLRLPSESTHRNLPHGRPACPRRGVRRRDHGGLRRTRAISADSIVPSSRGSEPCSWTPTGRFWRSKGAISRSPSTLTSRVPNVREVDDELVRAMASALDDPAHEGHEMVAIGGEDYWMDARHVAELDGNVLLLVHLLPGDAIYPRAQEQAWRGAITTGTLSLLGVLLALVVAAAMTRLRVARRAAEQRGGRGQGEGAAAWELRDSSRSSAAGAMGAVYRARHTLLAREAALKLIRRRDEQRPEELEANRVAFFEEARPPREPALRPHRVGLRFRCGRRGRALSRDGAPRGARSLQFGSPPWSAAGGPGRRDPRSSVRVALRGARAGGSSIGISSQRISTSRGSRTSSTS